MVPLYFVKNTHSNSLTRIKRFFLHIVMRQLQKKDSKVSSVTSTCHLTPTDDSLNGFRTYYSLSTSFLIELTNLFHCIITNLFVNRLSHHFDKLKYPLLWLILLKKLLQILHTLQVVKIFHNHLFSCIQL